MDRDNEIELVQTIQEKDRRIKELETINENITRELLSRTDTLDKILNEMYNETESKSRIFELYIETKSGDKIHKYFRTSSTFIIIKEKDLGEELYKFDDNGQLLINNKMYKIYSVSPIT